MVFRSPHPDVQVPEGTLHDVVLAAAQHHGDKVAMIDGDTGETLTYHQLHDEVRAGAAGLRALGVRVGDVVAVMSHNQPRFAIAVHAVLSAGATITPVNPMLTPNEVAKQLTASRATVLLTSVQALPRAHEAAEMAGLKRVLTLTASGSESLASLCGEASANPPLHIDPVKAVAALPFSSGTTGTPKAVRLTHRNLVANLVQLRAGWRLSSDDVQLAVLPFFHIYGFTVILNSGLLAGATIVTLPRFELDGHGDAISRYGVTRAYCAPPMLLAIANSASSQRDSSATLRYVICGAAPLDTEVAARAEQRLGCRIRQGYGMTEASPGTHLVADDAVTDTPAGCVGTLVANTEARLVTPGTNDDVGPDTAGELLIRGPQVMAGYLDDDAATAEAITDGWLHTGDLVRIDADGRYWVEDRLKELIKYKGYQVAPAELEGILLTHPRILDAAVIGVPHAEGGEAPKAFVVMADSAVDLDEILDFVALRVARYKKIRSIEAVDAIPKSPTGKILRRVLKDRARA